MTWRMHRPPTDPRAASDAKRRCLRSIPITWCTGRPGCCGIPAGSARRGAQGWCWRVSAGRMPWRLPAGCAATWRTERASCWCTCAWTAVVTATWSSRWHACRRCRCSWPKPASAPYPVKCTCWPTTSVWCRRPATACISSAMPPGISIAALPAEYTALVLLSGADLAHVGPALDLAAAGGLGGRAGGRGLLRPGGGHRCRCRRHGCR